MTISPIGKGNRIGAFTPLEISRTRGQKAKSLTGFTLLETLIVLIIISVCCIISIPLFSRFMQSAKLDMTVRNVVSVLRTARSYAISQNSDYWVKFDNSVTPNEYYVYYRSTGTEILVDKKYKLPGGIWFYEPGASDPLASLEEAIEFRDDAACFKPNGQLDEAESRSVYIADDQTAGANYIELTVEKTTGSVDID